MKNEAKFVKEWVHFHHLVGFNKIVIFDDGSKDELQQVIAEMPAGWVDYIKVDWPYEKWRIHVQMMLQKQVISKCLDMFWNTSQVITFMDVDEFMFPCRDSWGPSMWTRAIGSISNTVRSQDVSQCPKHPPPPPRKDRTPFAMAVPCMRYGINSQTDVNYTASVLETYVRRASYAYLDDFDNYTDGENGQEYSVRQWVRKRTPPPLTREEKKRAVFGSEATYEQCQLPHSLCLRSIGLRKGVYFPNGSLSSEVFPGSSSTSPYGNENYSFATIHGPGPLHGPFATPGQCTNSSLDWSANIDYGYDDTGEFRRSGGMCCNHINFRSLNFLYQKLRKNKNRYLFNIKLIYNTTMDAPMWRFYEQVLDRDALDLRNLLLAQEHERSLLG